MSKTAKNYSIQVKVREGANNYTYEFSPPLDPQLTNVPRTVTNIVQKNLVPKNGGFALESVSNKGAAAILNIPKTTYRDVVDRLYDSMKEAGFDIKVTIEHFPARPAPQAKG